MPRMLAPAPEDYKPSTGPRRLDLPEETQTEPDLPSSDEVPWTTRLAIGSARETDRMATVRSYFPDAKESEKGGYVFKSPKTGRPTYVNPPGFDWGDPLDWARTGAEAVGGGIGGTMGAGAGGPVGAIAGAGAGTALTGQLIDAARAYFGQPQTYSSQAVGENITGDVTAGAAGEVAGQGLGHLGKWAAGQLVRPEAAATVAAAEKAGVPVTARMTMRGALASPETAAAKVLPYSRPQRAYNELQDVATRKIGELAPELPPNVMEPANVAEASKAGGAALKTHADRAYAAWKAKRLDLDDQFYGALPSGVRFKLPSVAKATADVQAEIAKSPGVQGEALKPVQAWLDRINRDVAANGGALPPGVLRQLKTQLGAELETGATTELAGPVQARLKALYRGINEDLGAATAQVSPKAAAALHRHNAFVTAFRGEDLNRESTSGALDAVLKADSDEKAWNAFNSGGVERMKTLVKDMKPEEHAIVARATFERMTTTPAGNKVAPEAWATKWLATPKEKKEVLFGNVADVDKMDALAKVLREQAKGAADTNTSGTAYEMQRSNMLGSFAGGAAGSDMSLGKMAAVAVPYGLAELYRPAMIKGIVKTATGPVKDTVLKRMIKQLGVEAGFDPLADMLPGGRRR